MAADAADNAVLSDRDDSTIAAEKASNRPLHSAVRLNPKSLSIDQPLAQPMFSSSSSSFSLEQAT